MGLASKTQVVKFIRKGADGKDGAKGEQGATLRGPQAWSDCAVGYAFQAGGDGEEWKDVVLYNGNYYSCKASHAKTASNYPGSTAGDALWQLGDKIELVATKILLATYALVENLGVTAIEMKDSSGNAVFTAKDGAVTCNTGTFNNVTVSGTVTAEEGRIAGFKISGDTLTNEGFNNDAAVIFRNTNTNAHAAIGGNVLPPGSPDAVAVFSNGEEKGKTELNYGLVAEAKGAGANVAIYMLGGCISGFAMKNKYITSGLTSVTLSRMDYNVVCGNSSACTVTLPSMAMADDGHVIRFKRIGNAKIKLALSKCYTYNGTSTRYATPVIMYDRGSYVTGTDTLEVLDSLMDSFELVWVRDMSTTLSGITYYGAWVQYKLPRDW